MAHKLEQTKEFIEVHVHGSTNEWEILRILKQLHDIAPRKEKSDIWFFAEESLVPWSRFAIIVKGIAKLLSADSMRRRSAIVVSNEFQYGQVDLYCKEAAQLPFETRAFMNRTDAENWLRN